MAVRSALTSRDPFLAEEITRMITDPRATWIVRTAERAAENPHRPALPDCGRPFSARSQRCLFHYDDGPDRANARRWERRQPAADGAGRGNSRVAARNRGSNAAAAGITSYRARVRRDAPDTYR